MKRRFEMSRSSRRWFIGLVLLAGGSVGALTVPAGAAPERVNGHFSVQLATGSECSSPVGVCMAGSVSGRIMGAFSFTATSVTTADADGPVVVTTGDATVDTADGTINCKLTGTLQLGGDGPFVSLCVVNGGTGGWAGATGYLRTSGTFLIAGGGEGSYEGKVVAP